MIAPRCRSNSWPISKAHSKSKRSLSFALLAEAFLTVSTPPRGIGADTGADDVRDDLEGPSPDEFEAILVDPNGITRFRSNQSASVRRLSRSQRNPIVHGQQRGRLDSKALTEFCIATLPRRQKQTRNWLAVAQKTVAGSMSSSQVSRPRVMPLCEGTSSC